MPLHIRAKNASDSLTINRGVVYSHPSRTILFSILDALVSNTPAMAVFHRKAICLQELG